MKPGEIFLGFDPAKQEAYEKELIERYGDSAAAHIEQSKKKMAQWTKDDGDRIQKENNEMMLGLVKCLKRGLAPDHTEVQAIIRSHYRWICNFWQPNRESYVGLGNLYLDHSEFRVFFQGFDGGLASYLVEGMKEFAKREL